MSTNSPLEQSAVDPSPTQNQPPEPTPQQNPPSPDDLKANLSKKEKWFVVILIALAAFFGPFSANIYFPAIPIIARAFQKPIELINLTVTVYVILQGLSPMICGPLSDNLGRRPISAACLLLLSLSCVGIALVPTSDYWLLLLLRCIQAVGSSSTLAIGAGVISDISTPAERGGFYGVFALGPMTGPALGPVIGGGLAQGLGWRAIFWFLCIAVSICLTVLVTFFPETLPSRRHTRSSLKMIYTPILPIIGRRAASVQDPTSPSRNTAQRKGFQNPLPLFTKYNVLLLLILNSMSYSVFFGVVTSLSTLFEVAYPFLDEAQIGLCFLATGGSMALGTGAVGKCLDWRYQVEKRQLRERLTQAGELEKRLCLEDVKDVDKLPEFPLERARLKYLAELVILLSGSSAGYGWCIQRRVHLAGPLILQAIIGLVCMSVMNGTTTLMIDLTPGQGSAVSACVNLMRCMLAAIIISVIQPIINAIGVGWTYVLLGVLAVVTSLPCFYLEIKFGPKWRAAGAPPRPSINETASSRNSHSSVSPNSGEGSAEGKPDEK